MKAADEKTLARAKRVRGRRLARLTAMYQACNCTWPIDTYRNGSGHDSSCPAHALHQKFQEEDQEARDSIDW